MNCSGRSVADARRVIEIEEVLEASRVVSARCGCSARKICFLVSSFSVAASMARSAVADGGEGLSGANAGQSRVHVGVGDDAPRHLPGHVVADQLQTGVDALGRNVIEQHLVAREGADMGDAAAHLARADHPDRSDIRHHYRLAPEFPAPPPLCALSYDNTLTHAAARTPSFCCDAAQACQWPAAARAVISSGMAVL